MRRNKIRNYNLQLMRTKQHLYNLASRLETHRQTLLRVIKVKHEYVNLIFIIEPVLFVDVNLGSGVSKRITVFENDTAEELAEEFSKEHSK